MTRRLTMLVLALVIVTVGADATAKPRKRSRTIKSHEPPIAYYLASIGEKAASVEGAIKICLHDRSSRPDLGKRAIPCEQTIIVVRGPYPVPKRRSALRDAWWDRKDYPYRGSDGEWYSPDGYVPTP